MSGTNKIFFWLSESYSETIGFSTIIVIPRSRSVIITTTNQHQCLLLHLALVFKEFYRRIWHNKVHYRAGTGESSLLSENVLSLMQLVQWRWLRCFLWQTLLRYLNTVVPHIVTRSLRHNHHRVTPFLYSASAVKVSVKVKARWLPTVNQRLLVSEVSKVNVRFGSLGHIVAVLLLVRIISL